MAKRFIDTGFLDQQWIRKLSPEKKIFLIYLMLKCDNGGIIDLDFDDASFWIGKKIDSVDFLPEGYLISLNGSGKYFMPKFIEWQYKDLSSQKFIIVQARQILEKHDLINDDFTLKLDKSYVNVMQNLPNDYVQGIGKGIGKGKGTGKEKNWRNDFETYLTECKEAYREFWKDEELMDTQIRLNPGIDVRLSIEKGFTNFWSTDLGWKHKKKSRSDDINWKSTIINSIGLNKVYIQKSEKPRVDGYN